MTARITPFPISKADPMEAYRDANVEAAQRAGQVVNELLEAIAAISMRCVDALGQYGVRRAMGPAEADLIHKTAKLAADVERLKWTPKGSR
jgi:hypothetical protein